jgi:putative ABC transport system permease protein
MPPLAERNLVHDRIRLAVTLTGVIFAVVLIVVQLGLFFGFISTTSGLIDHAGADLWIGPKHVPYLEQSSPLSERKVYEALAIPGVDTAEKYIVRFSDWQRPDGGHQGVQVVGFNPDSALGQPWNIVEGSVHDLKTPDAVLIDRIYREKLGVARLGQVFEIRGHRARVVGFTQGIQAFTTTPYVFTTFKNAQNYAGLNQDETLYILLKASPATNLETLKHRLQEHVTGVDIFTAAEFSRMTRFYWMFSTGAGVAVLLAALLGLVVGVVVVAQTIYATTIEHMREYGTLKAMGAPNGYVYGVIIKQAAISAVIGYVLGMLVSILVIHGSQKVGASIVLPRPMMIGMFGLTLLMCILAAVISINKVTRIDPAMVFKA